MPKVINPASKKCAECGADITGKRGVTCRGECHRIRVRRQSRDSARRRYEDRHPEMKWRKYLPAMWCLVCGTEVQKRPGVRTPTRCPIHQAEHERARVLAKERRRRFRRHGITESIFDALLASQNGACAICQTEAPEDGRGRGWHIDHDHACCPGPHSCGSCVRGLLCGRCNVLIGLADERPEVLNAAAVYVRRPLK